jgi:hypothetical protein
MTPVANITMTRSIRTATASPIEAASTKRPDRQIWRALQSDRAFD